MREDKDKDNKIRGLEGEDSKILKEGVKTIKIMNPIETTHLTLFLKL